MQTPADLSLLFTFTYGEPACFSDQTGVPWPLATAWGGPLLVKTSRLHVLYAHSAPSLRPPPHKPIPHAGLRPAHKAGSTAPLELFPALLFPGQPTRQTCVTPAAAAAAPSRETGTQ